MTNEIILNNGTQIRVGDFLELGDLLGEKYKRTKNYDVNLVNPIEIHKYDKFDFKYVELIPTKKTDLEELPKAMNAHKLFSKFIDQVKVIETDFQRTIVLTNYFKIDINKAILNNEVKIIRDEFDLNKQKVDIDFLRSIQEYFELYSIGLFTLEEFNGQLEDINYFYFQFEQRKWEVSYARSLVGRFYKMKKKNTK